VSDPTSQPRLQTVSDEDLLTRLARGLAHEIKNPLSTMAINLTLLEEEFTRAGGDDPRSRRVTKRVHTLQREVSRLEGILDDFLHYARGGLVNRQPGDLVALVREVLEFMDPEHRTHEIRVLSDLESGLPLVLLDEGVLRQMVINLMVNARQAMPGGGELILQVQRVGSRAQLVITDTGVGMNPEELEHCFDMYWSTKRDGTGLGLSTVRRIVLQHEGTIGVISEKGRGTSFTITLPLVQEVTGTRDVEVPEDGSNGEQEDDHE
jgi:signal transduction histidine kinase